MIQTLHRVGSRLRHSHLLEEQRWLWEKLEPAWQRMFEQFSAQRGYPAHINDDVFRLVYAYGARYDRADKRANEPITYGAFVKDIKEGMTVFDIDAHVGFFTLAAAKRVGRSGRVFPFEPAPETLTILRQHILFNNRADRVEVISSVVSDSDGITAFFANADSMAASLRAENWKFAAEHRPTPVLKIEVPSIRLDTFCKNRHVKPNVLKIDVEGAELLVLRGAKELLNGDHLVIHCEVHPLLMKHFDYALADFRAYLDDLNYQIEPLDDPNRMGIFHCRITRR